MKRLSLLLLFLLAFSSLALILPTDSLQTQEAHATSPNWKPFNSCLAGKATCLDITGPATFFNGLPNPNQTSHYVFTNLGIDFWYNSNGNFSVSVWTAKWGTLTSPCLLVPNGSPVIVNASTLSQSFKQSIFCGANTMSMTLYFKQRVSFGYVSLNLKQAIAYSFSSYPATLSETFLNPLNAQVNYDSTKRQILFGRAGYNWDDAPSGSYNLSTNTLSWNVGTTGVIDPTTIGTSTSAAATSYSNQHKVWYQKNTRDWDFYSDGTNCVWRSSTDGTTWSATTTVRACTSGNRLSTWVDSSNNIYYCFADNANNNFGERDGTLNSDGTITWNSLEVTVSSSGTADMNCNIFATATTNIWISVSTIAGGTSRQLEIWKCAGTCGNAVNWSNNLTTGATGQVAYAIASSIVGLSTNQKMFVVWGRDDTYGTISVIDTTNGGTGWTTDTSPTNSYSMTYSGATRIGDTLHFGGLYTGGNVGYWSYPQGGSITADLALDTTTTVNGVSISAGASTRIIVAWTDASDLFYKLSTNSGTSFGAKQTISSTESSDQVQTLTADPILSSTTALTWTAGAVSPFNVRFAIITVTNTFTAQSSGGNFPASSTVKVEGLSNGADTTCTITTGGLASASQSCTFDLGTPVVFNGLSSQGTSATQMSAVPVTNGLVYCAMLNENSGTNAFDCSGNGNTGTLTNSPTWQMGASCKFGSCLSFASASSQYVSLTSTGFPSGTTARSVFAWVKTPQTTGTPILEYGTGASGQEAGLWLDQYAIHEIGFRGSGAANDVHFSATADDNVWHHVGYTYDGTTVTLYLDKVKIGSGTSGISTVLSLTRIGASIDAAVYATATIEYVSIYNRVLSASEISEDYSATVPNITFSDTTGSNTHTVTYYKSDSMTASYSVSGGGTPTAPTLSFNNIGTAQTFTLTTSGQTLWLDEATNWSTTNPTTGSSSTERWDTNTASGTPSAGGTIAPVYYHQYACTCSYSGTVASGGAPSFSRTNFGSTTATALTTTATTLWGDNSGAYTITKPTADFPSSTERYQTNTANGTVSAAFTLAPAFYHQYLVTDPNSISFTCTRFGSTSASQTTNQFCDNAGTLVISGTYSNTWTSQPTAAAWIYNVGTSNIGIQLLGDQAISAINWITSNVQAPYLTFTTASSSTVKGFIPSASGLTFLKVTNNGATNAAAAIANNILTETGASPHEWDFTAGGSSPPSGGTTPSSGGGGGSVVISIPPVTPPSSTNSTASVIPAVPPDYVKLGTILIISVFGIAIFTGQALRTKRSDFRVPDVGKAIFGKPKRGKPQYQRPRKR